MRALVLILAIVLAHVPAVAGEEHHAFAFAIRYLPDRIAIEAGDTLTFVNVDPASQTDGHDITHDVPRAERLFASETILIGASAPVEGVVALEAGTYPFHCTRHTSMRGTLVVEDGY